MRDFFKSRVLTPFKIFDVFCFLIKNRLRWMGLNLTWLVLCMPVASAQTENQPNTFAVCLNQRCGVLDDSGSVVVPFEGQGHYAKIVSVGGASLGFFAKDVSGAWFVLNAKGERIKNLPAMDDVELLLPNLLQVKKANKTGLMNGAGNFILPIEFDYILEQDGAFIVYEKDGGNGIVNAYGQVISPPIYTSSPSVDSEGDSGMVLAETGWDEWMYDSSEKRPYQPLKHWLVSLKDGQTKEIPIEKRSDLPPDEFAVKIGGSTVEINGKSGGTGAGVINAARDTVIPLNSKSLERTSNGLIAFTKQDTHLCGYLNGQGKIIIPAQFERCTDFGKQGAFVQAVAKGEREYDDNGNLKNPQVEQTVGMIDRKGQWLIEPMYSSVRQMKPRFVELYPIDTDGEIIWFDTDTGKQVSENDIPDELIFGGFQVYSYSAEPLFDGSLPIDSKEYDAYSHMVFENFGLMNADGRALTPRRYSDFWIDYPSQYVHMIAGINPDYGAKFFPVYGKPPDTSVVPHEGYILGYSRIKGAGYPLRGVYRLDGQVVFETAQSKCGAEQLFNAQKQAIWPMDAKKYCAPAAAKKRSK